MRRPEVELLDDDLDDIPTCTGADLGLSIDPTLDDLEDEDDLGLRALYEQPEVILGRARWFHAV